MSLALKGQRFALFKTQNVLSCNPNYFGYRTYRNRQCYLPFGIRAVLDILMYCAASRIQTGCADYAYWDRFFASFG
ncbi:hypothetical protein OI70_01260 [Dickeya fangzhongdai]|nr:hypothetical protein OI70_01260 [Dickeya fangzhongdai]